MCKIIEFNGNRGNKDAKRIEQIRREAEKHEQRHTGGLSTEALVKEYVQNGKSIQKLVRYMIEQYGYMFNNRKNNIIEEVKRDVRYCDIYPEVKNKRFRAPLAVKIMGRWHMVEIWTTYASIKAFWSKMETIGNYNVSGFYMNLTKLETKEMKELLWNKQIEYFLPAIVEKVHDIFFYEGSCSTRTFDQPTSVTVKGEPGYMFCDYKMLELLRGNVILEGVESKTNNKHLLMMCYGDELGKYANYFEEKYRDAGVPLFYTRWRDRDNVMDWKTALRTGRSIHTLYRSIEGLREEYREVYKEEYKEESNF